MTSKIRKNLVGWFVKNILAPNIMRLDTPGFATVKKNYKGNDIEQRNIFYSELFMAQFERELVEKLGEEGKQIAYAIGKEYAYAYSHSYDIPRRGEDSDKSIVDFITFYEAFMGLTWGEFTSVTHDLEKRILAAEMKDHIVCRKNGMGYIYTSGNLAGGWQYIMQDPTIEGVQTECTGKGDRHCKAIWAPAEYLEEHNLAVMRHEATTIFPVDDTYREMNKVRPLQYSKASINDMIKSGFFKLENNALTLRQDKYCFTGHEMLYVMEQFAAKNKEVEKILYNSAFQQGAGISFIEKGNDYSTFIPDIVSALGLGDTLISKIKSEVITETSYFPYLNAYDEINYTYLKGFLSGLITGFSGKETILEKHKISVSENNLRVELS